MNAVAAWRNPESLFEVVIESAAVAISHSSPDFLHAPGGRGQERCRAIKPYVAEVFIRVQAEFREERFTESRLRFAAPRSQRFRRKHRVRALGLNHRHRPQY